MKNTLMKLLKFVLVAAAVALIVLLVFGIVLWLDWPLWVGFPLLLVLVAIGVGCLFLRKILLRRREQQFVQQVIEQDASRLKNLPVKEQDEQRELQDRWKEAIDALRRSHLRKQGNPLYVLPWYLVIGESGSGKTTAISSARLPSSFAEVHRASGISGTRNCDWWFFEQAIIIDTAGRYAIPVDQGRDKEEWQQFLHLLVKYRKKEPIHGLIVTIAADKLLGSAPEALDEDGRTIGRRIDELMRVLGAKFPVYLLVTKCDLIQGMTQFCDHLPEKSLDQPMGVINQDLSTEPAAFLDRAMGTLSERLRNFRLLLLHPAESRAAGPGLLLFPEEFENLKRGLDGFIRGAFQKNPYQETPILRGLFFSSGRQEGSPFSHFLHTLGLVGEGDVLPGTSRGLFLHDFFASILPKDRGRFAPTKRAMEWRSLTRNLGLTAWILLGVALSGLLSFSFVQNLRTVREASREVGRIPTLGGDPKADLNTMDRFGQAILVVENRNRNWWIPRFGLNESIAVEVELKKKFCSQFQRTFLASVEKQLANGLETLSASGPDEIIGAYAMHLVRRVNLLKARMENQGLTVLQSKPQPKFFYPPAWADQGGEPDVGKKFGTLYLYYVLWRPEEGEIRRETEILQAGLKRVLALKRGDGRWLTALVDQKGTIPPVTLKDYWGGGETVEGEVTIAPSYTRKGKEEIDLLLKEIDSALPHPQEFSPQLAEFERWYRNGCFHAWQTFGADFSRGAKKLQNREAWRQIAPKMASDEGPYLAFMSRMAKELQPLATEKNLPVWLQGVYQFQLAKAQGVAGGVTEKAVEEGKSLIDKIGKKIAGGGGETSPPQPSVPKTYQNYQNSLAAIVPVAASTNQAQQLVSQAFGEDPAVGKSPFFGAHDAYTNLLASFGGGSASDGMLRSLLAGPVDFLWAYARIETACSLQSQWEQTVLAGTEEGGGKQTGGLMSPEGPIGKFIKGPAAPFLGWTSQKGYFPKEVLGGTIPFEPSLFAFLRQSEAVRMVATKTNYIVSILGLPTDTNPGARQKPQSTHLELQCNAGAQNLDNFNYRVSRTFQWSLESCGDVTFRIQFVNGLTLVKKYTGNQAFPDFLHDFPTGQRTFSAEEFPENAADLKDMGVKTILVRYEFGGDIAAVKKIGSLPGAVPKHIASCWAQ